MERSQQALYEHLPIPVQALMVNAAGWNSYRNRFGEPFRRILEELNRSDFLDAEAARQDQQRRLRNTIVWAAETVPHYREMFRREGIDPRSIKSVDDLKQLPFLEKETVRTRPQSLRSERVPDRHTIPARTSGTTGTALRLYYTKEALGWEYGVTWRQRSWYGVELGDKFATFGGQHVVPFHQQAPPFWRYDWAGSRMIFSLYHMSPENLVHYAAELHRPVYRFWQGYPSSIGLVSQYLLSAGVELGDAAPAAVFTSSETLLDFHRDRIAEVTEAPVADRYGNAEFSVSALQCPMGRYHVDTEFCVLEIDPHEETDEWIRGEVISTGFANRAMPFIRYRTGDIATLLKQESCACGRARPVIERIDGRLEDYIITPEGRRIGRMDHVFKDALEVREAQIFQPSIDRLIVRIVPGADYTRDSEKRITRELRARVGNQIRISYELRGSLPREPNGKFRAVASALSEAQIR